MIAPSAYAPGAQTVVKTASIDATRLPAIYCFIFTSLLIVSRLVRCLRQHPRYTPHPLCLRVLYHFSAHATQLVKQLFRACVLYQNERRSGAAGEPFALRVEPPAVESLNEQRARRREPRQRSFRSSTVCPHQGIFSTRTSSNHAVPAPVRKKPNDDFASLSGLDPVRTS